MRRLKLMRRGLVIAALLLVLTLLPRAPMAAGKKEDRHPGPPPKEGPYIVSFGVDLKTDPVEPVTLTVIKYGGLTVYYGYANIVFDEQRLENPNNPDEYEDGHSWAFFVGRSQHWQDDYDEDFGKVWITVNTRSGETWFYYDFDRYLGGEKDDEGNQIDDRYIGFFKYELRGPLENPFDPTVPRSVSGQFEIVQMFYYATSNGKKSATSVAREWRWTGHLEFAISSP